MIRRLACYASGAVRVRVCGAYPERFINCCIADGVELWGIRRGEGCVLAWLALPDFFRIRPAARKSGVRVRVARRYGFPFLLSRWKKRQVLLAGAAFFFLALYWLGGYVWFVEVRGVEPAAAERIARLAEANGLYAGARLEAVDGKAVEKALLLEAPELAWAGVRFTGTRAVVEVVERVRPQAKAPARGDLVAAKAGTITECIAIHGEKLVAAGDAVAAGDVLIRSASEQAEGIVKARIVYESFGEAPLCRAVYTRTGRKAYGVALRAGGESFAWSEGTREEFPAYEAAHTVKRIPPWRNSEPAVELDICVYRELAVSFAERDAAEAERAAALQAQEESGARIPEDAYVAERQVETLASGDPNVVKVRLRLITEEEIGKYIQYGDE